MDSNKVQLLHHSIRFYLLIAIAATLPLSMALNTACILLLSAHWIIEGNLLHKIKTLFRNKIALIFAGFYILFIVGLLYTSNVSVGFHTLEIKAALIAFPVILSTTRSLSKKEFDTILFTFVLSCSLGVIICIGHALYQFIYLDVTDYFFHDKLALPLQLHIVYFSIFIAFSICISMYFLLNRWKILSTGLKMIFVILILSFLMFLFLLSSKIVIISMVILINIFIPIFFSIKKKLKLGVAIFVGVNILITILLLNINYTKQRFIEIFESDFDFIEKNEYKWNSPFTGLSLRITIWKLGSIELSEQNKLIFGVGTGDRQDFLDIIYTKYDLNKAGYLGYNSHNQYVEILVTLGITGILYFLFCLSIAVFSALREKDFLFLSFLVLFIFTCLTESMLELNKGIVFYAFFNTLFLFSKK